jgi:hypothetical protein
MAISTLLRSVAVLSYETKCRNLTLHSRQTRRKGELFPVVLVLRADLASPQWRRLEEC